MEIVKKCEWCHKTFIAQMVRQDFAAVNAAIKPTGTKEECNQGNTHP